MMNDLKNYFIWIPLISLCFLAWQGAERPKSVYENEYFSGCLSRGENADHCKNLAMDMIETQNNMSEKPEW